MTARKTAPENVLRIDSAVPRQCYLINLDGMPFADSLLSFFSPLISFLVLAPFLFSSSFFEKTRKGKVVFFIQFCTIDKMMRKYGGYVSEDRDQV